MLSVITSCALNGIEAYPVTVEIDVAPGLPGFTMVGLPDSAVKESRERVFAALKNSGFAVPSKRITVNLAPGAIRKEGTAFDLALALGLLLASGQVDGPAMAPFLFLGELSLDGRLRPVRGVLPAALMAKASALPGLVVPWENGSEASLVPGVPVFPVASLAEALDFLRNPESAGRKPAGRPRPQAEAEADFAEVKGQGQAKRALEVAAAGGHNFLLIGSPGCGKTMLARRMPSILPLPSEEEVLETTRIYSVAGLLRPGMGLITRRPFRSPHHSISDMALVGGGSPGRPGELSLAHNGLLFLDELPEFRRNAVEALRQPLEEGAITVSRVAKSVTYPARVILGAAMNPCPCGRLGEFTQGCRCRSEEIARYRARISGPLLDRIDIHLEVPSLSFGEISRPAAAVPSAEVRARVMAAREVQRRRFLLPGGRGKAAPVSGIRINAQMNGAHLQTHCSLGGPAQALLKDAVVTLGLSARAHDRILKVARTMADLEGRDFIEDYHIAEAIHYRTLDRPQEHMPKA